MVYIGIDFGTTNMRVAIYRDSQAIVLENDIGSKTTPFFVAFDGEDELIGQSALDYSMISPASTIYQSKRVIGRRFDEPYIQNAKKRLPFNVVHKSNLLKYEIAINGKLNWKHPEEISGLLFANIKQIAEKRTGQKVAGCVITVPSLFNCWQRQATADAAAIGGLITKQLLNDSTAAAIAFGNRFQKETTILVFSLGGGCLDISIIGIEKSAYRVYASGGSTELGGEDFDYRLFKHLEGEIELNLRKEITKNPSSSKVLLDACKRAKEKLSNANEARIHIPQFLPKTSMQKSLVRNSKTYVVHYWKVLKNIFKQ